MSAKPTPSQEFLLSILDYDPGRGELRWRARADRSVQWNGRHVGQMAGSISKSNGRRIINLEGELFLAYRLIWKMVHGVEAPSDLDHADGDCLNDRLANLRPATKHENLRNSKLHKNKDLPKGVSRCGKTLFRSSIFIDGKGRHLGVFKTPEAAHAAYVTAASQAFGEFARYA